MKFLKIMTLSGVLFCLSTSWGSAHTVDSSQIQLTLQEQRIEGFVSFNLDDLARGFELDPNDDLAFSLNEIQAIEPQVEQYLSEQMQVLADGEPLRFEVFFLEDPFFNVSQRQEGMALNNPETLSHSNLNFRFHFLISQMPHDVELKVDFSEKFGEAHSSTVGIVYQDHAASSIFNQGRGQLFWVHPNQHSAPIQVGAFILSGIEHILIGYDHILFLLALILWGGRFWELLKIVTSFTVAHSITLALATLNVVQLPGRWIECAIALSIVFVAVENFFVRSTKHRWILTFLFGLIHGFGFANVLKELELPRTALMTSLVTFNVGVELGQMAIVAVLFLPIAFLSKRAFYPKLALTGSLLIGLFGFGWFVERVFNLSFMPL